MKSILIKAARVVNRGEISEKDIYIRNGRIEQIDGSIDRPADLEIIADGKTVMPELLMTRYTFVIPALRTKPICIPSRGRQLPVG